ncbi:hypothetical protein [Fischerella sp. PCC 9605]|uniref:hypothetical protein n=1 Tax=Fischerella sp. PCC 9605 TaxID=1173024 RepID=UPI000479D867|nr:hypothetical protein [Fischerella sp. PCC 9605]
MKDKLDDSGLKKWQLEPQLKKEIEERQKELAEINKKSNKEIKPISFSLPNNDIISNNDSLADILYRIRKSQLASEIKELQKELENIYKPIRPSHDDRQLKDYTPSKDDSLPIKIDFPSKSRQDTWREIHENENLRPTLPPTYISKDLQNSEENTNGPSSSDKPRNTILFWLIALLVVMYFLSHQGTNEKQQPNQQDYPKDVPALSSE